jgi:outer membrane protein assembly factor BamB
VRALTIVIAISSLAHADALGIMWRTKYPTKECRHGVAVGAELVSVGGNALVFFDRATGRQRSVTLPKLDGKRPADAYVHAVVGDTVIVGTSTVPIGIDAKTGALRWQRTPSTEKLYRLVFASGSAHVVEAEVKRTTPVEIAIERFDATTGTAAWKATVPTQRERFTDVVTSDNRVFVISMDVKNAVAFTIVAFDLAGKQLWSIDHPLYYLPTWATIGDDLVAIKDNAISVFAGADGKNRAWTIETNAHPIVADGAIYATPVDHSLDAYDRTGAKRWTTKLAGAFAGDTRVIGGAGGLVYVQDRAFVHVVDAATGKLLGSTGIPDLDHFTIHKGAPALTRCAGGSGRSLVAYDPSTPAPEHRVKVRGRVRCKNCDGKNVEVAFGNASVVVGADGRFAFDVVARGALPLDAGEAGFFLSTRLQVIDFTVDRTLTLGDVVVRMPDEAVD